MGWRQAKERWCLLTPLQRDTAGAVLLAAAVLVEVLSVELVGPVGAVLTQSLAIVAATAFRRTAPILAVGVAAVAGATNALIYSGSNFDFVVTQVWAVILLAYSVAAHAHRPLAAAAGFLLLLSSFWIDNARQDSEAADYLASLVAVAAPWLAGWSVRQARRQAHRLDELNRQLGEQSRHAEVAAAAAERLRIARELHDIVAHSLTVVALQADAADALLPERPDAAQRAVVTIRTTARDALEDMRRLLGTLRPSVEEPSAAPSRGLQDMERLVRDAVARGQVQLSIEGERLPLPRVVDEAAYRIVQEGLTNAHRHGDGDTCAVTVRYTTDAVEVDVWNSAHGTCTRKPGFGLIGIQERVQALGGQLVAGPTPEHGWRLRAHLPLSRTTA